MAVGIPVVIDIDQAFIDAAKRVGANMHQIENAVEANSIDLFPNIGESIKKLETAKNHVNTLVRELKGLMGREEARFFAPGDVNQLQKMVDTLTKTQIALNQPSAFDSYIDGLSRADIELEQMREHYRELEESSMRMSNSINGYRARLQEVNEQWNRLTATEKYVNGDPSMGLSQRGQELYTQFKNETKELEKQGRTLSDLYQKEQRRLELTQKGAQKRKYENAILSTTAKTMQVLQEQERILSERLSRTAFGSSKYQQLKTQLQGVRQEMERVNKELNGSALDNANSKLANLVKNSIRLVALHAGTRFIRNVREVTAEFELQRVALGSIIQDTEKAEDLFKQIKAAAIESPFEIKDLVSYTKQLSAYQIETDKLFDTTMKLADVSAGLGVDMGRLILAYGQVRAAAVLRGQELRQFTEAGIPLVEKLADKFTKLRGETVKTGEVFELISERAVPFSMIEEIFDDLTSAGGEFYKMQEKQAKTLAGQWANLKDSVSIMYDEIGNTAVVHGAMEALIQTARSAMTNWRSWASAIGAAGSAMLTYVGIAKSVEIWTRLVAKAEELAHLAETKREKSMRRFVTSLIGKTAAEKVSTVATNLHTAAVGRAAAANTALATTFWNLTAAMLSNPFGILAVAIGGVIALVSTLSKKTRDVSKDIDSANASIASLNKSRDETAKLIDEYEELSNKTRRTEEESRKLRDISRELASIFPKTAKGIDEQTGALTLNIEKLKGYNKEAQDALVKGMEAQMNINKKTIQDNQKEIERLTEQNLRGTAHKARWWSPLSPVIRTSLSDEELSANAKRIAELRDENYNLTKSNEEMQASINGVKKAVDDSGNSLLSWQTKLGSMTKTVEGVTIRILDSEQLKQYSSLDAALEDIAKKYKEYEEQVKVLEAALRGKNEEEVKDIKIAWEKAKARKELAKEELDYYNAFFLTTKKTKSSSDKRLQNLKNEISEITNAYKKFGELKKYKDEAESLMDIGTLFPQLAGWAPTFQNTIAKLQSMLDDVKVQLSRRPKDTVLLDMQRALETEISNLNFDNLKQDLDNSIKQLSDEIKRSETARDFYQSILGLTGDEDLAATMSVSVYGGIGQDFKERLQQQLNAALSSLDASKITDDLRQAFASRDFDTILANLDKFPEVWQQKLKEMAESSQAFDAERAKDLLKSLEKAKTYGEQRVKLAEETARRMKEIEEMNVPQPVKDQLQKQNRKKEAEDAAKMEYEAFKDTPMYIELFADLDSASVRMLTNMRENLVALKSQWKDLMPTELKELQSRINELDEQIASRNPFKALIASIKEYREMQATMPRSEADLEAVIATDRLNSERQILDDLTKQYEEKVKQYGIDSEEARQAKEAMEIQASMTDLAKEESDAAQEIASQYRRAAKHIMDAAEGIQEWAGYVNSALSGARDIVDVFGSEDFSETFGTIAEGTVKTLEGAGEAAMGLAKIFSGTDIAGGIMDLVSGIGDLVVGIGGTAKKLNVQQLNKQIKEQARLIQDLEESYNSLSKSLDKAFGNERIYNFNKMMEVMAAEMEAYRKQAEAERAKGKKADEDTALGYERSARELDEKMRDLREQQDAFFAGADLASAAESFADAWLSAYEEFGDTSTAIEERMTEMVQTLMKKAALSGIAQNILGNWYSSLADVKDWNAQTIAEKWKEAMALVNPMVEGMQVFANSMQAEGVSLRNTVGQFTGISRDIAGASEESINGLAAGINTQNFYMSFMPMISENVAQILTYITGGNTVTPTAQAGVEGMPSVQTIVYNNLPAIRSDIGDLLQLMKSVISVGNVAPRNYVAIK